MPFSQPKSPCRCAVLFPMLLLATGTGTVLAQDASLPLDRVSIRLGGYYANVDTDVAIVDKSGFLSGNLNLEKDLGFRDSKAVPRVRADFLFGEHEGLALDYYRINRASHALLARDVSYAGVDYHADANLRAKLNFDFGSVAWRWWFGQGNDAYGVGMGGAWYLVKTGLAADGSIDVGVGPQPQHLDSASNDNAWAPMLQLGWRHAFNDQWRMYLDASGVRKNGGRLSGHIYNGAVGVEWRPWEHWGLGAEYDYSQIRLHWLRQNYDADLDMSFSGPSAYVKLSF